MFVCQRTTKTTCISRIVFPSAEMTKHKSVQAICWHVQAWHSVSMNLKQTSLHIAFDTALSHHRKGPTSSKWMCNYGNLRAALQKRQTRLQKHCLAAACINTTRHCNMRARIYKSGMWADDPEHYEQSLVMFWQKQLLTINHGLPTSLYNLCHSCKMQGNSPGTAMLATFRYS